MTTDERKKLNRNRSTIAWLVLIIVIMISWVNSLHQDIAFIKGENESLKINSYNKDIYINLLKSEVIKSKVVETPVTIPVVKKKIKTIKKDTLFVTKDTLSIKITDTTSVKN